MVRWTSPCTPCCGAHLELGLGLGDLKELVGTHPCTKNGPHMIVLAPWSAGKEFSPLKQMHGRFNSPVQYNECKPRGPLTVWRGRGVPFVAQSDGPLGAHSNGPSCGPHYEVRMSVYKKKGVCRIKSVCIGAMLWMVPMDLFADGLKDLGVTYLCVKLRVL